MTTKQRLAVTGFVILAMFTVLPWGGLWYLAGMIAMACCKDLLAWARLTVDAPPPGRCMWQGEGTYCTLVAGHDGGCDQQPHKPKEAD